MCVFLLHDPGQQLRLNGTGRRLLLITWGAVLQMGIKQVDLYLVHYPALLKDVEKDWRAFEKLKEAGLAKCAPSRFRICVLWLTRSVCLQEHWRQQLRTGGSARDYQGCQDQARC